MLKKALFTHEIKTTPVLRKSGKFGDHGDTTSSETGAVLLLGVVEHRMGMI